MIGKEIILQFQEDKAFITYGKYLTFNQLIGLPEGAKFFKSPAYWTIKILNYWPSEKRIYVSVLFYSEGEREFNNDQIEIYDILNEIEKITFKSIDTGGFLRTYNRVINEKFSKQTTALEKSRESTIRLINEPFFIPIKNLKFKNGRVTFEKKFKSLDKITKFEITNSEIREEFDAIKNYFENVLDVNKIQVIPRIQIFNNEIISSEITSPEIEKINKDIIESVKLEFVKSAIINGDSIKEVKSIFTLEEYFEDISDSKLTAEVFFKNNSEFLEYLIKVSNSKHYNHLRYLSSKHSHGVMKLRFIQNPFSFLFLIKGEQHFHIVWETLNTEEATYIWHIQKDTSILRKTLEKIDSIIKSIKIQGKASYINAKEESFRRLYHDYSDSIRGFIKWKEELENILT